MPRLLLVPRIEVPSGLLQPAVAVHQDGVFTRSQARAEGWSDDRQRALIRAGIWVALTPHVLRNREVEPGPWHCARAVALAGRLVVSHATAGRLWGLRSSGGLHGIATFAVAAPGVHVHRSRLPEATTVEAAGLVLTDPLQTIADLIRTLPPAESVDLITDALQRGLLGAEDLDDAAVLAHGMTGAARARWIARTCATEPHSVLEWRFHQGIRTVGSGWEFNVPIYDSDGLVGVVDAFHRPTGTIVELDSRAFHGPDRYQPDRTRDQRLAARGYVVLRFTWEDIDRRPEQTWARIRHTLAVRTARPRDLPRIASGSS
jgi:hypothetical protein